MIKNNLKNKKILFSPHEIGNQMQLMANEFRNRGIDATAATYTSEWYGYKNDINLNLELEKNRLKLHYKMIKFSIHAIASYDIFHFHFGKSLYGNRIIPHIDVRILKRLGKKVYMHFRGSDLIEKNYYATLKNNNINQLNIYTDEAIRVNTKKRLPVISKFSDKIFVSTPNMLDLLPEAILIPQIISKNSAGIFNRPFKKSEVIKIVHAPTDKNIKGTKHIVEIVNELSHDGFNISLEILENKKPKEVIEAFKNCHFGIDQLFSGWYGKVSIELMQLGKPVFCFIHNKYFDAFDSKIPIINVNKKNLKKRLKYYLLNIKELQVIGEKGVEFVNKFHSQKSIVDKLITYYKE